MINAIKDISGALRSYSLGLDPGNDARDLAESKEALSTTETRPTEVEARCASLRSELESVRRELRSATNELSATRTKLNQTKRQSTSLESEVKSLRQQLVCTTSELDASRTDIQHLRDEQNCLHVEMTQPQQGQCSKLSDANTLPVMESDASRQLSDTDTKTIGQLVDLFFEKYDLKKKRQLSDSLVWMTKAIRLLPNDPQLELGLEISDQVGDTEIEKVDNYEARVVSQFQSMQGNFESEECERLSIILVQISELKEQPRFQAEMLDQQMLQLFLKVESVLPACKEQHLKFSALLHELQIDAVMSHKSVHDRWEHILQHPSSHAFSYEFLKRVLNGSLRLQYVLRDNITLTKLAQETSFRISALFSEEACAILHIAIQNTFSTTNITADEMKSWFKSINTTSSTLSHTQQATKRMLEDVVNSTKLASPVFKSTYGFVRGFRQKQEKSKLPVVAASTSLRRKTQELHAACENS